MNNKIYYGWIPALTKGILFDYFVERLERQIKDKNKINILNKILQKTNGKYYVREIRGDIKNKKFKAIVSINNKNVIEYVLTYNIYDNEDSPKAIAKCDIEDNGLVKLEMIKYPEEIPEHEYDKMVASIYITIRDVYHYHTHNEEYEDLLLKPVNTKDKTEAIAKILEQFEEKIITYHTLIRSDINSKDFNLARRLIIKAKGEMIYASSFVKLFEKYIPNSSSYSFVFSNALHSIDVLARGLELYHDHILNRAIMVLTVGILIFTAPIAIDATFGFLKYLGVELTRIANIVPLFYILALLIIIYILSRR